MCGSILVKMIASVTAEAARATAFGRGTSSDVCPHLGKAGVGRETCSYQQKDLRYPSNFQYYIPKIIKGKRKFGLNKLIFSFFRFLMINMLNFYV